MARQVLENSSLHDKVFAPDHEEYEESIQSYWSLQEIELKPSAVVKPRTAEDVAQAIKLIHDANTSNDFSAPFAIRGGGHQAYPGSANIGPNGLTIDLRQLRHITITEDCTLVTVGTGNSFEQVYNFLEPLGLNVPGAKVAQVGVAGFCLGGGLSYYTPKAGFVCDNIEDYEIVLANGSIVHANGQTNSDLWTALKGGSNNFGIVTAMTMWTIPKEDLWGGTLINDISVFPQSAALMHEQISSFDNFDTNASIMIGLAQIKGFRMAYHSLKYTKPVPNPPVFREFINLPCMQNSLRQASLAELTAEEGKFATSGARRLYMTCSFKSSLQMLNDSAHIWEDSLKSVAHLSGLEWSLVFTPIVPSTLRESWKRGGYAFGIWTTEPLIIALLVGTWDNASDDEEGERAGADFIEKICARAKELDVFHPYIYMNYAWKGQRVIDGYGQEAKESLQRVSRKYDPDGLFQKAVPGGFKVFD